MSVGSAWVMGFTISDNSYIYINVLIAYSVTGAKVRATFHFLLIRDIPHVELYVLNMFRMRGARL